jgi:hypothetical protein
MQTYAEKISAAASALNARDGVAFGENDSEPLPLLAEAKRPAAKNFPDYTVQRP